MIRVTFGQKGESGKLLAKLRDAKAAPYLESANMQASTELYARTMRNYEAEGGFFVAGGWQPLNARYKEAKVKKGYSEKILVRTGNLRNSFEAFSTRTTAGVGARASFGIDYAEYHEKGLGHNPRRRMLPRWNDVKEGVVPIYRRAIEAYFNGR